jgi:hypothetical protein
VHRVGTKPGFIPEIDFTALGFCLFSNRRKPLTAAVIVGDFLRVEHLLPPIREIGPRRLFRSQDVIAP